MTAALLVVSDTHGDVDALTAVLAWAKHHGVTALAHLGDGVEDLRAATVRADFSPPAKRVRGNGDSTDAVPTTALLDFAGRRFFLCHGHLHGVQDDLGSLVRFAATMEADAVLFGHTHRPFWEEVDGLLVLNPGSLGKPRSGPGPSFATVECPENQWFSVRYWTLDRGILGRPLIREFQSV